MLHQSDRTCRRGQDQQDGSSRGEQYERGVLDVATAAAHAGEQEVEEQQARQDDACNQERCGCPSLVDEL